MDLISAPLPTIQSDNNYELACVQELKQINADILQAIVDSYYAGNTSHCKFVSGICVKLAGGDVLYKTQYQAIIDLSSTEAEFIAACKARKYLLYLRTILSELGRPQMLATVLYEDNQGALLVATAQKPTKRTRHMYIKHFAIQYWVQTDLLCLQQINTSNNYADAMTIALGKSLFYRHNDYLMGRIIPT